MKPFIFLLCCVTTASAQTPSLNANAGAANVATNPASQTILGYQTGVQDGNSRVWQKIVKATDPKGNVTYQTNQAYVELATGLNHKVNGKWVASKEEIDIAPDGNIALATNGQHQAYFPGDIYNGKIEMVTPDGKHLYSRPVGLSYFDGTNSVLIAELTNSTGEVVGNNQVVYANAFTDFKADLRYTYTKAGFEQDVILREQPPTPASFGLNPDTTRLQVLTEFFDPPQPTVSATTVSTEAGNLENDDLGFGAMAMVPGKAFLMGTNSPSVGVNKQWLLLDGRQMLVEELPVSSIADELENLPLPQTASTQSKPPLNIVSAKRLLPEQRLATNPGKHSMQLAQAIPSSRGLVLDYVTMTSQTNYTFQGDTTYYISGTVNLYGTNTFEGGTVLKYAPESMITLTYSSVNLMSGSSFNCQTSPYRPAVFTARDDNTVGETISGSTGNPSGSFAGYAGPALNFNNSATLSNFRIAWANTGIDASGGSVLVSHGQFVSCGSGIGVYSQPLTLTVQNLLFANCYCGFSGSTNNPFGIGNSTFSGCAYLALQATLRLTNCILANVTNLYLSGGTYTGDHNGFYNSPVFGTGQVTNTFYPFQTVGAGSYYLTNGCAFTNAGTTNIDPTLLADLRTKTTHPPIVYSNVTIPTNLTLSPIAQRDTNSSPSLGYHYDPLDYVFGGCDLYTNLTLTPGTAVGWFESSGAIYTYGQPYGITLNNGANLTSTGTVTQPCSIARFSTVQEGNGNWTGAGWMGGLIFNSAGSGAIPQLNAQFTKWYTISGGGYDFRDNWAYGVGNFDNCEFYAASIQSYYPPYYFTNCLLFHAGLYLYAESDATNFSFAFRNCTFDSGLLGLIRYAAQSSSFWTVKDTAFDGTAFYTSDYFNGATNHTAFDYNAYNLANTNWEGFTYNYSFVNTNLLETVGAHDLTNIVNYNWQSSWLGNYYQATNSQLIDKGETNANLLGLYHYTTQTNQVVEGDSIVDIGYHYVATDTNGIPLDSNGDGIPDYLEDANGNGLVDPGEIGWNIVGDLNLQVLITRPRNRSVLP